MIISKTPNINAKFSCVVNFHSRFANIQSTIGTKMETQIR